MRAFLYCLVIFLGYSCENPTEKQAQPVVLSQIEQYDTFDKQNHLKPAFNKASFDTLHGWDFGWAILEPINIAKSKEDEIFLSKRLSPGQKALYFFWYLDAEVTNGGFIQFYWNGYETYLSPIKSGLTLIGDKELTDLVIKSEQEYLKHQVKFDAQRLVDDWKPLYDSLTVFDTYDSIYYKTHNRSMELIEQYARKHPEEFVDLK